MYSDFLFNINQIIEENGLEETSNILSRFAGNRPFFALDSGITCNDIWERSKKILQCIEAIEDEDKQRILKKVPDLTWSKRNKFDSEDANASWWKK